MPVISVCDAALVSRPRDYPLEYIDDTQRSTVRMYIYIYMMYYYKTYVEKLFLSFPFYFQDNYLSQ